MSDASNVDALLLAAVVCCKLVLPKWVNKIQSTGGVLVIREHERAPQLDLGFGNRWQVEYHHPNGAMVIASWSPFKPFTPLRSIRIYRYMASALPQFVTT